MFKHLCIPKRCYFPKIAFIFNELVVLILIAVLLVMTTLSTHDVSKIRKYNSLTNNLSAMQPEPIKIPTNHPSVQRPKPQKQIVKKPVKQNAYQQTDFVSKGYLNFYNAVLEQELFSSIYLQDLKSSSLSSHQRRKLLKICLFLIGSNVRRPEVATGYACLLQLHELEADKNSELDTFKAIKYASLSIETFFTPDVQTSLMRFIIAGYEDKMTSLEKYTEYLKKYRTGYRDDEKAFLDNVLKLNIPVLNRRVMIRQSFIHTFGRSSSNENAKHYDLKSAIAEINYVRSTIQVRQTNIFDVVLTFDEKFVIGGSTCIVSALINSDLDSFYRFHVIMSPESPLSEDTQRILSSFNYIKNYTIDFTLFPVELISDNLKTKMHLESLPLIVVYRLYFDILFPDLDSVLFLDVDTLVLTDLNALKTVDMSHYIWAGVPGTLYRYNRPECNGVLPNFYINAGVLLVNLTNMRKASIREKIEDHLKFVDDDCDYKYSDQDVINTIFADYIYHLPFRWNSMIYGYNRRYFFNAFIVHYPGDKPWYQANANKWKNAPSKLPSHKQEWWRYRDIVRWR